MSENELGAYLRARREALKPADVGLPEGGRRRTPGLRRSELATVAGVSVEYLTRLEQGRDRNPSVQVLVSLADALRMTPEERMHLRHLAKLTSGSIALCPAAAQAPARTVRPAVRALLERLEPAPAALLNRLGEIIARTTGFDRLFGPMGLLDDEPPNLTRYVFTDVRARIAFPDWDRVADEQAAALKYEAGPDDPWAGELVEMLSFAAGEAFTGRMSRTSGPPRPAPVQRMAHPGAGELRLAREPLDLLGDDQRLLVYLPADADTAAALDRLTGRHPGALRAVSA
ncbi:helix-turn-helix domain-containing protein [Nonomuraea gerenzanensis]|uniref:Putative DNA-binding protein n=1 Tax=Nonomuraea gerenzanensis TaxID=93944 RepID=A0A1M4E981_9ACTN|nr:helix-turn-helix transcriptional regulator [Nonomuraea gerenzanensis]UBU17572.1 helix-turn-helix transcriptional regulator [Nonomuraea gerenzanensis]SBO95334.1 putative DNA-binding protein [Nonomuraea gerenzanensis]